MNPVEVHPIPIAVVSRHGMAIARYACVQQHEVVMKPIIDLGSELLFDRSRIASPDVRLLVTAIAGRLEEERYGLFGGVAVGGETNDGGPGRLLAEGEDAIGPDHELVPQVRDDAVQEPCEYRPHENAAGEERDVKEPFCWEGRHVAKCRGHRTEDDREQDQVHVAITDLAAEIRTGVFEPMTRGHVQSLLEASAVQPGRPGGVAR